MTDGNRDRVVHHAEVRVTIEGKYGNIVHQATLHNVKLLMTDNSLVILSEPKTT